MTEIEEMRTFSQADFDAFARLSGDDNPIHVDAAYAAATPFARPVAHGVMLYGLLRGLCGRLIPGARQSGQEIMFAAPTYAGEAVRFLVKQTEDDGARARFDVEARRVHDGVVTCAGWMELTR